MRSLNIDKVIFEAPLHKHMSDLAKHFNVNAMFLRYRLMKARKLMLVKSILKLNNSCAEE
jgi:hypothetical protein